MIQRVRRAEVRVGGEVVARAGAGLLLLVGVARGDAEADALETARKVAALRVFPGRTPMDRTVGEVGGDVVVVSQFTLASSVRKGNRPSFDGAEEPARAEALYLRVASALAATGLSVATGRFAADMTVALENDGPVTFVVDVRGGRVVEATAGDAAPTA